jgi:hypothetical protein
MIRLVEEQGTLTQSKSTCGLRKPHAAKHERWSFVAPFTGYPDALLRITECAFLGQVAKHPVRVEELLEQAAAIRITFEHPQCRPSFSNRAGSEFKRKPFR